MKKLILAVSIVSLLFVGCVERKLTINTNPQGALVILNDQQIGVSPVTVDFNWYGDYRVDIQMQGYERLKTNRQLHGPWYDKFPFDFFAMIYPGQISDSYVWDFELQPKQPIDRDQLIEQAVELKEQL